MSRVLISEETIQDINDAISEKNADREFTTEVDTLVSEVASFNQSVDNYVVSRMEGSADCETSPNLNGITKLRGGAYAHGLVSGEISLPNCLEIGDCAFYNCDEITSVDAPVCETLKDSAFIGCANLASVNLPEVNYFEGMKLFDANSQLTSISLPKLKTITMVSHLSKTYDGIFDSNNVESIDLPELSAIIFNSDKPNQPSELYIYDQNIRLRHIYLPSLTSIEGKVYNNIDITDMGNISFGILGNSAGEDIKDEDGDTIYSPLEAIDIPNLTTVNIQYINMQTNAVSYKPVTIIDSTSGSLMYLKRINLRNFGGTLAFSSTTESVICLSSGTVGLSALEVLDLGCSNIKNSTFYKTDSISGDKLTTIILRNTSMCSIESAENLIITATAANTDCYIYVPADLLDEYKADNVWSTVADKFRAIEDYPTVVNYKCEVSEIE